MISMTVVNIKHLFFPPLRSDQLSLYKDETVTLIDTVSFFSQHKESQATAWHMNQ